jgi:hypothetical protein
VSLCLKRCVEGLLFLALLVDEGAQHRLAMFSKATAM